MGRKTNKVKHICVLIERIELDHSSEGIVTTKFLRALGKDYQVTCVTSRSHGAYDSVQQALPWLGNIRVVQRNDMTAKTAWDYIDSFHERLRQTSAISRFVANKTGALISYLTGFTPHDNAEIARWKKFLSTSIESLKPDLIFIRGAGSTFNASIAASQIQLDLPWIANYHDPFPSSLYPNPYRHWMPIISVKQEIAHKMILREATALTFPCHALQQWVLKDDITLNSKAHIIPHIALEVYETEKCDKRNGGKERLVLLHTGSLLAPRNPEMLLKAYFNFLSLDAERIHRTQLVFIGRINRIHLPIVHHYEDLLGENFQIADIRIHYEDAVDFSKDADVLILLEHAGESSPFLPAKLSDYLIAQRPILALTPKCSAVRDILGTDYPLLAQLDAYDEIRGRFDLIWNAWKKDSLGALMPPASAYDALSEETARNNMKALVEQAFSSRRSVDE